MRAIVQQIQVVEPLPPHTTVEAQVDQHALPTSHHHSLGGERACVQPLMYCSCPPETWNKRVLEVVCPARGGELDDGQLAILRCSCCGSVVR